MFTEYLPDLAAIQQAAAVLIEANGEQALAIAVGAIRRNATRTPTTYLRYGCYWFSVKDVINRNSGDGDGLGSVTDDTVTGIYKGEDDLQTLIAAHQFYEAYLSSFFDGARMFVLGEDDTGADIQWQLFDDDME